MKTWKHINYDQRKTISACISHNYKLINISKILDLEPRSISREVKRNREPINYQKTNSINYEKLNRWPYVCANCKLRYKNCPFTQYKYVYYRTLSLFTILTCIAGGFLHFIQNVKLKRLSPVNYRLQSSN